MEVHTIDRRMKYLAERYRILQQIDTKLIWNELIHVIDLFLSGCQAQAFESFYKLFKENINSLRFTIIEKECCLYRMRVGCNEYDEFTSKEEMFHIPFQLNHLVANERYSMSGFPSLYLGSSVYVCWEEMRRPNIDYANIALFKTTHKVKVIDLSNKERYSFTKERFTDCLILACSLPVQHPEAPFKPEYIIPQLLLQSLVRYNQEPNNTDLDYILGIKYSSTHLRDSNLWINFPENRKNKLLFYNYVFPAFDRKESGVSVVLEKYFQFWNCITYNKLRLMNPDYQSDKTDKYGRTVFGIIEHKLQNMPLSGMLLYDSENPAGALTWGPGNKNL